MSRSLRALPIVVASSLATPPVSTATECAPRFAEELAQIQSANETRRAPILERLEAALDENGPASEAAIQAQRDLLDAHALHLVALAGHSAAGKVDTLRYGHPERGNWSLLQRAISESALAALALAWSRELQAGTFPSAESAGQLQAELASDDEYRAELARALLADCRIEPCARLGAR